MQWAIYSTSAGAILNDSFDAGRVGGQRYRMAAGGGLSAPPSELLHNHLDGGRAAPRDGPRSTLGDRRARPEPHVAEAADASAAVPPEAGDARYAHRKHLGAGARLGAP
jgi:hypothetical protein